MVILTVCDPAGPEAGEAELPQAQATSASAATAAAPVL
jgi:hypothetical protein